MAAGVTESRTYNSLLTTTLADFERRIEDQIFDVYPLLSYLNGKLGIAVRGATVKEILDGGESIVVHLLFEENSTVDSYSGAGIIDTTLQEGHTIGRYNWKQYAGTVGITGLEKRSNMGEARLINLLEAKIQQLVLSFQSRMSEDAYSDGTGNGGLNLTGLEAIVDADSTLAGLAPGTYPWWASTETTSGSFAAQGINDMRTIFNTLSWGNDKPDIIFTTQTIFEYYEKALQPQERFIGNAAADAGFMNLTFKNVPVVFDRDCTSGVMYFLNSKYIALKVHQDADMKTSEFVEPENQDVTTSKMIWQGNITTNNRRRLGKLKSITA
jgi:hypothetical protein